MVLHKVPKDPGSLDVLVNLSEGIVVPVAASAGNNLIYTSCPRSLDPFHEVSYYTNWVKTTDSMHA